MGDSETHSSRTSSVSEAVDIGDDVELDEVYKYLTSKLRKLTIEMAEYHTSEHNNPLAPIVLDSDDKQQLLLNHKLQYNHCLSQQVQHSPPLEWVRFPSHVQLDVMSSVKKEEHDLRNLLFKCQKQLAADKKHLTSLEQKISNLQDLSKLKQQDEIPEDRKLVSAQMFLNEEFKQHKSTLDDTLKKLIPDHFRDVRDLLADLCKNYFDDDSDSYMSVEGLRANSYVFLEMLLKADIITRHPHDKSKIRLTSFVD